MGGGGGVTVKVGKIPYFFFRIFFHPSLNILSLLLFLIIYHHIIIDININNNLEAEGAGNKLDRDIPVADISEEWQ